VRIAADPNELDCSEIAAAVVAAELTASATQSRVAHSAYRRDSTVARSDGGTQAAFRHGTKFPIW
jgi:maltoporin